MIGNHSYVLQPGPNTSLTQTQILKPFRGTDGSTAGETRSQHYDQKGF